MINNLSKISSVLLALFLPSAVFAVDSGDIEDPDFFYYDYSERDKDVVDYQMYKLPDVDIWKFRGPKPDIENGDYFTVLGSASSMGVLIDKPYPELVADEIGMTALNLATGGASATAYADDEAIINYVNNGKFLILQIMSAKAERISPFTYTKQLGVVRDSETKEVITLKDAWTGVIKTEPWNFFSYVGESRDSWVEGYHALLKKVKVPVILFWFAPHEPGFFAFFDAPAFVDESTLENVNSLCGSTELCDAYVEVTSTRNREFAFVNRTTGGPVEIDFKKVGMGEIHTKLFNNTATPYASQEMSEDAVAPLVKAIKQLKLQ